VPEPVGSHWVRKDLQAESAADAGKERASSEAVGLHRQMPPAAAGAARFESVVEAAISRMSEVKLRSPASKRSTTARTAQLSSGVPPCDEVHRTVAADRVEALEREPEAVETDVAAGAERRLGAVIGLLFLAQVRRRRDGAGDVGVLLRKLRIDLAEQRVIRDRWSSARRRSG
jgi:hypothetical protein